MARGPRDSRTIPHPGKQKFFPHYLIGSNLNFCPPMAAATITPDLGMVNTATPCSYFALAAEPDAVMVALAFALISHWLCLKALSASGVSKKIISANDPPPTCAPRLNSLIVT